MKSKMSVWVSFALTVFAVLAASGCATKQIVSENNGNFGEHTRTPVKDFVSLGLVFTETQLTNSSTGTSRGEIFTYQALLKEAQQLGADAIINVVIDKKTETVADIMASSTVETWYGSALAIKYTETLKETTSVTVTANGATTTQSTTIYFNEGGSGSGGQNAGIPGGNSGGQNAGIFSGNGLAPSIPRGVRQ